MPEIIIVPSFFAMVAWIVYVIVDGLSRRQHLRVFTEFHTRLLDRIGSAHEFGQFLGTEGGMRFLDSLSIERGAPQRRILNAVQTGIVLLAMGLALFMLAGGRQDEEEFMVFATVATSLGVGLLVAAAVSYVLSRYMGLFDADPRRRDIRDRRTE